MMQLLFFLIIHNQSQQILKCGMTYQQNKEHKEYIGDKVDWPEDSVCSVNGIIIKVSENNPELCEAAGRKRRDIK